MSVHRSTLSDTSSSYRLTQSSDWDRFTRLCTQLSHSESGFRRRAARSLLDKADRGLLTLKGTDDASFPPFLIKQLLSHLNDCIELLGQTMQRTQVDGGWDDDEDGECLNCVLRLIIFLSPPHDDSSDGASDLLHNLYSLKACTLAPWGTATSRLIQEVSAASIIKI